MKKTILITGYNGFIGSHLIHQIDLSKYNILGISNKEIYFQNLKISEYITDISDKKKLFSIDFSRKIDYVIHLAAIKNASCPENILNKINVCGTENIAEFSEYHNVKKIIFISSVAVYSPFLSGLVDENTETVPNNIYGFSKLNAERIIKSLNINWTILRPTNVFGERDITYYQYFKNISGGFSKVQNVPSHFIYVKDLCDIIVKTLESSKSNKNLFIAADNEKNFYQKKIVSIVNGIKKNKNKIIQDDSEILDKRIFSEKKLINLISYKHRYGIKKGIENYLKFNEF